MSDSACIVEIFLGIVTATINAHNPVVQHLLLQLQAKLQKCWEHVYIMHIRSHFGHPGRITLGTKLADHCNASMYITGGRAWCSIIHTNAHCIYVQYQIPLRQVIHIIQSCLVWAPLHCKTHVTVAIPSGLRWKELWQIDVAHINFSKQIISACGHWYLSNLYGKSLFYQKEKNKVFYCNAFQLW